MKPSRLVPTKTDASTSRVLRLSLNDQARLPGRLESQYAAKSRRAGPGRCSALLSDAHAIVSRSVSDLLDVRHCPRRIAIQGEGTIGANHTHTPVPRFVRGGA